MGDWRSQIKRKDTKFQEEMNKWKEGASGTSQERESSRVDDETDVSGRFPNLIGKIFPKPPTKPKSRPTNERYYDFGHKKLGNAVIFSQEYFRDNKKYLPRRGTEKDTADLKKVLTDIGFDVKVHKDYTTQEIRKELRKLSESDHSDCDCLLVTIMTHGHEKGELCAYDGSFKVQELWENFLGSKCRSLIGKPKLFFVQACRGQFTDPGVFYVPRPQQRMLKVVSYSDTVDSQRLNEEAYVIPDLADILAMFSTSEGYYSFRNQQEGSWFIQALCQELRDNPEEDLFIILTGVNRRVAFEKQSEVPKDITIHEKKQMPMIFSMLTKSMTLRKSRLSLEDRLESA